MAKVRVYELAKELGVTSKAVLIRLSDLGVFVRSASSQIDAPVVRRLAESFVSKPPVRQRPAVPTPGNNPFSNQSGVASRRPAPLSNEEQLRREAAEMFGGRPEDVPLARQVPPRGSGSRPSPRKRHLDSWERNLIGPDAKRAWIRSGLGPDDGDRAWRCAAGGLSPDDLLLRVEGCRAGDRIRGGESIASVAALVAECKYRQADSD